MLLAVIDVWAAGLTMCKTIAFEVIVEAIGCIVAAFIFELVSKPWTRQQTIIATSLQTPAKATVNFTEVGLIAAVHVDAATRIKHRPAI